MHSLGVQCGGNVDRSPGLVPGAVQAAGQSRIVAGVARQPLLDGIGDEVRPEQRPDQRHRVMQVAAVDPIRLAMERDVETHRVTHDRR